MWKTIFQTESRNTNCFFLLSIMNAVYTGSIPYFSSPLWNFVDVCVQEYDGPAGKHCRGQKLQVTWAESYSDTALIRALLFSVVDPYTLKLDPVSFWHWVPLWMDKIWIRIHNTVNTRIFCRRQRMNREFVEEFSFLLDSNSDNTCMFCRRQLMNREFVEEFSFLLDSNSDGVEVSYNAAGQPSRQIRVNGDWRAQA